MPRFPGTILAQTSSTDEIKKADLDLLDKINQLGGAPGAVNPVTDTAANFTSKNPTLKAGQLGYETDTKFFKFGDGTTAWTSLSYQSVKNAPLPQTAAGVGQIVITYGALSTAVNAPAGGSWQYIAIIHQTLNGTYFSGLTNTFFGICAGGAQAVAAVVGWYFDVFFWRIA